MLSCLIKDTNQRITFEKLEESGMTIKPGDLICPITGSTVFARRPSTLKSGGQRRGHFFLKDRQPVNDSIIFDPEYFENIDGQMFRLPGGESELHLVGKRRIGYFFNKDYPYEITGISFEDLIRLPDNRIRVADVVATLKDGSQVVGECQISPITPLTLEERTRDYERAGLDCLWFFGEKSSTAENERWAKDRFGEFLQLVFRDE